ncbi:type II toxin-antitoxin system RelE/ParE family toxin [Jiella avicenniae]|uniref:type II toxin-antitoxin system RelE/ParE family toxin n=1 Tax=Jiella avicenniae TaxID=2907202 RepID=UPI0030844611
MQWEVVFHPDFDPEFERLDAETQDELLAQLIVLREFGPKLGRPKVDTLNASMHANMKELRFRQGDGVWRFAFAFDLRRRAIVLCGGDKTGKNEKRF